MRYKLSDKESKRYDALIATKDMESFSFMLNDPRGRWFLERLAGSNFVYNSTFTGNSSTFLNEGRRSVILELFDKLRGLSDEFTFKLILAQKERFECMEKFVKEVKEIKND